jgi:hypothetical protein
MRIRLLALVGVLGVLGGMLNAERPAGQIATMEERVAGSARNFDDPFPPPTPRP